MQLSGIDSFMALGETPNMPLHIGAIMIYKTRKKHIYEEARALLVQQIEAHLPVLRCRLESLALDIDRPYWVKDEHFTIDYHLQHVALPKPADWNELYALSARFYARPLNKERPLWEALFIEGLDNVEGLPKGSVALVLKIHHAIADGKTAIRLFSTLHSESKASGAALMVDSMNLAPVDFNEPGLIRKYAHAYLHNRYAPQNLAKELSQVFVSLAKNNLPRVAKSVFKKNTSGNHTRSHRYPSAPRVIFNREPAADRMIGHLRMDMKELKKVSTATGATINDIALCVVGGALRSYLKSHADLPDRDLLTGMPISIRNSKDNAVVGNRVGFSSIALATSIADPLERLQAIQEQTHIAKGSGRRKQAVSLLKLLDALNPGALVWLGKRLIASGLIEKLPPYVNTVVTNVPGTRKPVYFCGAELVDYIGLGVIAPTMTLFHTVSSLEKHVNISFLTCSGSMQKPKQYQHALEQSWQSLLSSS